MSSRAEVRISHIYSRLWLVGIFKPDPMKINIRVGRAKPATVPAQLPSQQDSPYPRFWISCTSHQHSHLQFAVEVEFPQKEKAAMMRKFRAWKLGKHLFQFCIIIIINFQGYIVILRFTGVIEC